MYGRLTVTSEAEVSKSGKARWVCSCSCGGATTTDTGSLNSGNTTSCGCARIDSLVGRVKKHGMCRTRTYGIWSGMLTRCTNKLDEAYSRYGGIGITVCNRWAESFENFFADMGECPSGLSIERIDNDLGYSPENCEWATYSQQAKNTRRTRLITSNGKTLCISDWAKEVGISEATIRCRIDRFNWSPTDAVSTPANE